MPDIIQALATITVKNVRVEHPQLPVVQLQYLVLLEIAILLSVPILMVQKHVLEAVEKETTLLSQSKMMILEFMIQKLAHLVILHAMSVQIVGLVPEKAAKVDII